MRFRRSARAWYRSLRERYEEGWGRRRNLDRVIGPVDRVSVPRTTPLRGWTVEGELPAGLELLVSTSRGLLHLDDGVPRRLLSGKTYGITRLDRTWVAFRQNVLHGAIVTVPLDGSRCRTLVYGLSLGVHQIDVVGSSLVLVDTYANRLLQVPTSTRWPVSWRRAGATTIGGETREGRLSPNYRHFNSVFAHDDRLYLVAHNDSVKTGRSSELWVLDRDSLALCGVDDLGARAAHNYWTDGERALWCDSLAGQLVLDHEPVFEVGGFTRGLSVSDDLVVVGSSDVQGRRAQRDGTDGRIHVLSADFEPVATVYLSGEPVQELRRLDRRDRALSNARRAGLGSGGGRQVR